MKTCRVVRGLICAAITVVCVVLGQTGCTPNTGSQQAPASSFERVVKEKRIRCGYVLSAPSCMKDPNTGKLTGYSIEIMEEAARLLGFTIDWSEDLQWGTMLEGLGHRCDLIGSTAWLNSTRAKAAFYTTPVVFSGVGVWVRADDNRFGKDFAAINSPNVRIATADGELAEVIAKSDFPKAEKVSLPQLSDVSQLMEQVIDGKADVALMENNTAYRFAKKNPGKMKNAAVNNPVRVFPESFFLPSGDVRLKMMLDATLMELLNSGFVDRVITKYEEGPAGKYRVALPYRAVEARAQQ